MAPPELQLIHQILGSPSNLACSAWFADKTDGWQPWAKSIPSQSTPDSADEICKKLDASCTYTAFNVAKLLSAKEADGKINFDLNGEPKEAIAAKELEQIFHKVNKVFWVRAHLDNGLSHAFVVTSYAGPSNAPVLWTLCLMQPKVAGDVGTRCRTFSRGTSSNFLQRRIRIFQSGSLLRLLERFIRLKSPSFRRHGKRCSSAVLVKRLGLKEALVKVLDRTLPQDGFLEKSRAQWPKCPHELDVELDSRIPAATRLSNAPSPTDRASLAKFASCKPLQPSSTGFTTPIPITTKPQS